jgi:predicted aminopeptidase
VRRLLPLLPLLLSGCYYVKLGLGQLDMALNSESLEAVENDPALPAAKRRKIQLVRDAKEFGERAMGLAPSDNYTTYYDTGGRPVTWVVTACAKDKFEPYLWSFPIVGTVPYKGFFSREDALAEAAALEALDLDVHVSPASAYSTLGYFKDPVLSTMLEYPDEELVSLILHELTHGTIFLPGGVDFNEGLANFVGAQGAKQFFRGRGGEGSTSYARAVRSMAREERRDARARAMFNALDALYKSDASREDKLALREEVAAALRAAWKAEAEALLREIERLRGEAELESRDLRHPCLASWAVDDLRRARERLAALPGVAEGPVNNAVIQQQRRYGRYDAFRKVFEEAGGDWGLFFKRVREVKP